MANEYFDVMTSIINKKKISHELILKHFNPWQTYKWLSGHPQSLYESNIINTARGLRFIDIFSEYKALKGVITVPKNTYIKMLKENKELKIILNLLQKHFKIGRTTAQHYFNILPDAELIKILNRYSRVNENMMSAKELNNVKDIRKVLNLYEKGKKVNA